MIGTFVVNSPGEAAWEYYTGLAYGAYGVFVEPVVNTGKVIVDVGGFMLIDGYEPLNPHIQGMLNGERTWYGGTISLVMDALVVVPVARGGQQVIRLGRNAGGGTSVLSLTIKKSGGQGLIGLVRPGGEETPEFANIYIEIAQSPEFARCLEKYNVIARRWGLTEAAGIDEIVAALRNDVTFTKVCHIRSGVFTEGQHPGLTRYWLQGNPTTRYGRRVGRHELVHLGAALRGQRDTIWHEIAVQWVTTPENVVISGGTAIILAGGTYYLLSR
ncbi:MAG: hypothetical protein KatS3mg107_1092 [Gemmataceae bacterium]|jgi:hypothetical protein|nr:MAG: hypothetical protein KatS3mg107_1092 [Gemmataceae bacterium]